MSAAAGAGGAATKGLTSMLGVTTATTMITSIVQGGMDIHAAKVNLEVHKINLDQQPPQHLQIPSIEQK